MRVASFNVMHGAALDGGPVEAAGYRAAVAGLAADVLALQEVDRDQPRSGGLDLTAEAAAALGAADGDWRFEPTLLGTPGEHWRAVDESPAGPGPAIAGGPAYGIGLVSRFPVARWWSFRLPAAPIPAPVVVGGWPRRVGVMVIDDEPRAALAAAVETPAGPVTVVSTHLSFVPGWNVFQLRRLVRALAADLPEPIVLLGDLNMPGAMATAVSRWTSLARVATYPSPDPRLQIDHALGRGDVPPVTRVAAVRAAVSDHAALVVDLADR